MFTKSIGRLAANANRRRDERAVRIHPEARDLPGRSATPHKRARGAAGALYQIKAEAPTAPTPLPDAFAFEPFALAWMDQDIAKMRANAADKESHANQLLGEASRLRTAADTWERLRRIADVFATDEPPAPVGQETPPALAGDVCFGCKRSRDTLPCYSALEGREVPLCPRCHPSAGEADDTDDDTEAEQALDAYIAAEPPHDEDLPEALGSEPFGPAAVAPLQQRDTETIRLPWGRPVLLDDTLIDLMDMDGVER